MENSLRPPPILLSRDQVAFLQGNVVIYASSTGIGCQTNLVRSSGCRVDIDGSITVFVCAAQAGGLLADVRANRALAIVFCEPRTDRALQLKTRDAETAAVSRDDYRLLSDYHERIVALISPSGFDPAMLRTFFKPPLSDAVALRFKPYAVFDQTPGPNAGAQVAVVAP